MDSAKSIKTVTTDVLCIGGGGAGVMAAIAAKKAGARVILASKGKIGNSGDTIMIGGSYSMDGESARTRYGLKRADPSFTKAFLFEQIVKQSFFLSEQPLVRQFVEESPPLVYACHEWGERAKQKQAFTAPAGWMLSGHSLGVALKQGLSETPGIETIEDFMVVDLIKDKGKIAGAVGFNIYTGESELIRAKAVVIGSGGYQPFSVTSTNSDVTTGDGIAMAYRAGAQLADMEFMLFIPTALEPESSKGSILPYLLYAIGLPLGTLDGEGKSIEIPRALRTVAKGSELGKVIWNYYWSASIAEGKGSPKGGLYMDCSKLARTPRFIFNMGFKLMLNYFKQFYKYGYYHSDNLFDFKKRILEQKKLEFGLCSEYSMGGIVIGDKMETRVPGLYAAGEASSGLFGACRVADATTEMMVQGNRAGLSAAQYASGILAPLADEAQVQAVIDKINAPLLRGEGPNALAVMQRIHTAVDGGFGPCRNETGLSSALKKIEALKKDELPSLTARCKSQEYNYERLCALQSENLLTCAEAGLRAALARRESRGFHVRSDYPQVDNDRWAVRILEEEGEQGMSLTQRKPEVVSIEIPEGKEANIADYIVNQKLNFKNACH